MEKIFLSLLLMTLFLVSCEKQENSIKKLKVDYTQYANPFVGTSKMGHTFPGATALFGMVQLSPQTNFEPLHTPEGKYNKKPYEYCADYQYREATIIGFFIPILVAQGILIWVIAC